MRYVFLFILGCALLPGSAAAQAQPARALDPAKAVTQYIHQAWQIDDGLPQNSVRALVQTQDGYLWLGTEEGLARFDGVCFTLFDKSNTDAFAAGHNIRALLEDRSGTLWIGTTGSGLIRFSKGRFTPAQALPGRAVEALHEDADGTLWVGTRDAGLFAFSDGRFTPYTLQDGASTAFITALLQDRAGALWVGTPEGLYCLNKRETRVCGDRDGLSGGFVTGLVEDRKGTLWVATLEGLKRLNDGALRPHAAQALNGTGIRALWEDPAGSLWIGMEDGGLGRIHAGRFEAFSMKDGLTTDRVLTVYGDREGGLWIGTEGGGLNYLRDGKITTYTTREHLSHDLVLTVYEDAGGAVWIGTQGGGLNRLQHGQITHYTTEAGLSSNVVLALHEDREGTLWIGTYEGGLNRLKAGVFTSYTTREGLFNDNVFRIMEDEHGHLWMSCNKGIFLVRKASLNAFADGTADRVYSIAYGKADGLKSVEMNGGSQPAGWKGRDGRLWFPTVQGVAMIDPEDNQRNTPARPVVIEALVVDAQHLDPGERLELPPGRERIEFHYTAPSFAAPDHVSFRYMLEGYNTDWQEGGAGRVATYTNLDPGPYTFRVIARNSDGNWSESTASLALYLKPYFYQTAWFYALSACTLLCALFAGYRLRIRQLKSREKILEKLVEERTHDLRLGGSARGTPGLRRRHRARRKTPLQHPRRRAGTLPARSGHVRNQRGIRQPRAYGLAGA